MPKKKPPGESVDLSALDARLDAQEQKSLAKHNRKKHNQDKSAMGAAVRVASDLIGGIVVGIAIGYGLGWFWPDLSVLFIALGFVLGVGVGMYNVWRAAYASFGKPRS